MKIRAFQASDEAAVVALWQECGLTRPWNDPHADIARKLTEQPELFLVGTVADEPVATAMVGFDGHRGWVYYLAVSPRYRRQFYGRSLMREAERLSDRARLRQAQPLGAFLQRGGHRVLWQARLCARRRG